MKMKAVKILTVFIFITVFNSLCLAAAFEAEGVISKVTVYRGQALVTRNLKIDLPTGSSEVIVTSLPSPRKLRDQIERAILSFH